MKVLLIDDSSTMRNIQKRALGQMGVEEGDISEAGNGIEALEELKKNSYNFDLIMCDINMPQMNGIETVKALRQIPEGKSLPVIMCTSVAEKSSVIEAVKAGANNYLVKPFRPEDLKAKIEQTLQKK